MKSGPEIKSWRTETFKRGFSKLSPQDQRAAEEKFKIFKKNPHHPSLRRRRPSRLKGRNKDYIEVSINMRIRAVAEVGGDEYVWIFIGPHTEFEKLIDRSL